MEGTRNEKALLVLCSYVIGFTTAYIAYGISYAILTDDSVQTGTAYTASVAELDYNEPLEEVAGVTFELVDSELTVNVEGEQRLVSITAQEASLSPSSDSVYFCETASGSEGCTQYEYSISEDVVRPLIAGEQGYSDVSVDAVMME